MNRLIFGLIALFGFCFQLQAQSPGFSAGNVLESQDISGRVTLRCSDGREIRTAYFHCQDNILRPFERDRFVYPDQIDADTVKLRSVQENGKVRVKSEDFNSQSGESDLFNLWVSSLFQRPLLAEGLNRIDFEMTKRGVIKEMGSFDVLVDKNPEEAICRPGFYYSNNMLDCRTGGFICQRYFRDLRYCQ